MKLKFHERVAVFLLTRIGHLSLRNIYRLAAFITFVLNLFPIQLKRTIRTNIEHCYPHLSRTEQEALMKESLLHTVWRLVEMPFFWFSKPSAQNEIEVKISGEEQFQKDFSQGKGAIVLTGHFGAWEMVNSYMGPRYPCVTLYKPMKKAYQEELVQIARERYGVEFSEVSVGGVKKIFESLKQGKCLGIMSDHDPGENGGIFAPFFGIPANTMLLPIKLIQKTDAPVYTLSAERLPKGAGFHIRFKKIEGLRGVSIEEAASRLNRAIENIVVDAPAQYEWSYKRFRRTPTPLGHPFYEPDQIP